MSASHPTQTTNLIEMKKLLITLVAMMFVNAIPTHAQRQTTRGIGVYPGRLSESFAPTLRRDFDYRNTALHRMVYQSSSLDANLTGQLVTDGTVYRGEPCRLQVSMPDGVVARRDAEKLLDGNVHTRLMVKGEETFVQFDWTAMDVDIDAFDILAEPVYQPGRATGGYAIDFLASNDGKTWTLVGGERGDGMPGEPPRHTGSNDPNKQEDPVRLPMRLVKKQIPFSKPGRYSHLRIRLHMTGCTYWRFYEARPMRHGREQLALPSSCYTSAWMSAGGADEWLMVDLGTPVIADRVVMHWIHPARRGEILVSQDGDQWQQIGDLGRIKVKGGVQTLRHHFTARYVKLMMRQPDPSGHYALSELQVMGRGGLSAIPAERQGMFHGRYYLNGGDWRLFRDGAADSVLATVPATALQSYINIGAVPNTNHADNLRMVSESFFHSDFTYTTTFDAPAEYEGRHVFLNFDGINWKASVRLNGHDLGRIEGAFMRGRFDVTGCLLPTGNRLEVRVERPAHFGAVKQKTTESTDMNGGVLGADNPTFHASIGWDWMTSTPGRETGIWNDVYLSANGGVSLADPLVDSRIDPADSLATMTPKVWVTNHRDTAVVATLRGWIGAIDFARQVTLQPRESREVTFSPDEFAQLQRQPMHLWWPVGYGKPHLYRAGFALLEGSEQIDSLHYQAGIRQMTYKEMGTRLQFFVNHRRVVPLGGNWGFSETNLCYRGREYDRAVRYHKEMNFNMIRNWVGQTGDRELYEACDRHGLLLWQDFWLANPWDGLDPYDNRLFMANAEDYIRRIRRHASIAIYVGRNEGYPPAELDSALRRQVDLLHPGLGYISSSADDGVSGHGPYRAVEAEEYFTSQSHRLHSERGMPNIPTIESLRRMLSPADLWPIGEGWAQHDFTQKGAQRGSTFLDMMQRRFGPAADARQFAEWAQWINYDGYRAMYESAQQDRQGLLIWMSHPAWPSMVWQTYDYYLEPTAAYFGARKACEPLHIMYNAHTRKVQVVNITPVTHCDMEALIETIDMRGRVIRTDSLWVDAYADATTDVAAVRMPDSLSVGYLRLRLYERGYLRSDNFYVQAASPECYSALKHLPVTHLTLRENFSRQGDTWHGQLTVTNTSDTPTLMIRLCLKGDDGEQILPVVYSDNYFALMPGEIRDVTVEFADEDRRDSQPHIEVSAFNGKAE